MMKRYSRKFMGISGKDEEKKIEDLSGLSPQRRWQKKNKEKLYQIQAEYRTRDKYLNRKKERKWSTDGSTRYLKINEEQFKQIENEIKLNYPKQQIYLKAFKSYNEEQLTIDTLVKRSVEFDLSEDVTNHKIAYAFRTLRELAIEILKREKPI